MRLICLGSKSKGNCYLLDNGKEALMLECGVSFLEAKRALDFQVSRLMGCLVSHEHGDHSREWKKVLESRVPIYCSLGTSEALKMPKLNVYPVGPGQSFLIGSFKVKAFNTQHDAREPFGFLIYHPECGRVLFATDTYYLKYRFRELNNIMLECNYRQDILDEAWNLRKLTRKMRERTVNSHMSYNTCLETLLANDLSRVNNIVLLHLSDGNSSEREFKEGIQRATGKRVTIADKGVVIEHFNKTPF